MNIMARLKFELTYYDSAAQRFVHYTTRAPKILSYDNGTNNLYKLFLDKRELTMRLAIGFDESGYCTEFDYCWTF